MASPAVGAASRGVWRRRGINLALALVTPSRHGLRASPVWRPHPFSSCHSPPHTPHPTAAEYDLLASLSQYLDPHMVFPLLTYVGDLHVRVRRLPPLLQFASPP